MKIDADIGYLQCLSFYIVTGSHPVTLHCCLGFSGVLAIYSCVINHSPLRNLRPQQFCYTYGIGGQRFGQDTLEIE